VIPQKTSGQVFHSNEHKCVEKHILLENVFHLKYDKNYVQGLYIKSILYVYQNAKCNLKKIAPKIYPSQKK